MLCTLSIAQKYSYGQNLIKNGNFREQLNNWTYHTTANCLQSGIFNNTTSYNRILSLSCQSSISQIITTTPGEVYDFSMKIMDIKGDSVFVNFYMNDLLVNRQKIYQEQNNSPFYIHTEFLAEESLSNLKIEIENPNDRELHFVFISDIICNNKALVKWADYYTNK